MPTVAVLPYYRIGASPLALEIMRIYNAGSSVYASVYEDAAGTIPMGNSDLVPIQADGYGLFPVVFVPVGAAYDIKYYSSDLVARDTYEGISPAGGSGSAVDAYKIKISNSDATPGYLGAKLLNSPGITWSIVSDAGVQQIQATVDAAYVLDGKVKVNAGDSSPGYLMDKLESGKYIDVSYDPSTYKIKAEFVGPDYVPKTGGTYTGALTFQSTTTLGAASFAEVVVTGNIAANGELNVNGDVMFAGGFSLVNLPGTGTLLTINEAGLVTRTDNPDTFKVIYDAYDYVAGYLGAKIRAGTGVTINTTTDGVNGTVMHINASASGGAPLHEVISGDGDGGILSSPAFTAVNGDVVVTKLTAGGQAEMALGAAGGGAWFGPVGFNPSDPYSGQRIGMTCGEYNANIDVNEGGSISMHVGTSPGRLTLWSSFAQFGVHLYAEGFQPFDGIVLGGTTYTSTYKAVICFRGTGTTFAVPAGGVQPVAIAFIAKSIRLCNSSAVGIAITGVASPFTLAPGTSRDLWWDEDPVNPRWY